MAALSILQGQACQTLQWRHNECGGVSNHQHLHRLLNGRFKRRSKKTSKLRVTGLCAGKSPVSGEFPAQKASNAENASIWWRHHEYHERVSSHWALSFENVYENSPLFTMFCLPHTATGKVISSVSESSSVAETAGWIFTMDHLIMPVGCPCMWETSGRCLWSVHFLIQSYPMAIS